MTIRLRAHHLLCLLTYAGKGYSPAFTANMDRIAARLPREDILLVGGPDEICAPLLDTADPHCHRDRVRERDRRAARDLGLLLGRDLGHGATLTLAAGTLDRMRRHFHPNSRAACQGCEWSTLCTSIAEAGFIGSRLLPETDQ